MPVSGREPRETLLRQAACGAKRSMVPNQTPYSIQHCYAASRGISRSINRKNRVLRVSNLKLRKFRVELDRAQKPAFSGLSARRGAGYVALR
jgi:hypothetical protein